MVDRQDIDALLIGSLYGELSSTEEARLTAHLESHPADRTALADLTRARTVVRESRILQVQFEPPQSISALLMQEAARRAPKARHEMGWFQRFMRSVLLHPAMAAAAMLVLIIGVAGTMYLKKGDQFARQTKDEAQPPQLTAADPTPDQPAMTQPATTAAVAGDAGANGLAGADQYRITLQEGAGSGEARTLDEQTKKLDDANSVGDRKRAVEKKQRELAFETKAKETEKLADKNANLGARTGENLELAKESSAKKEPAAKPAKVAEQQVAKTAPKQDPRSKGYIEVTTPDKAPKDFDSTGRGDTAKDTTVAGGGVPGRARTPSTGTSVPVAPSPPPPEENKPADAKPPAEVKPDPMLAWAKEQHGKAIAAAKKDCKLAASIVTQIANRAPAYYAASIENDRALKSCQQYIAAEREKEVERANRAKATQRRATDEAPAPAKATSK